MIIRGQKVLKVKKLDYTKNPEAQKFVAVKAAEHVPEWKKISAEREENSPGLKAEITEKEEMEEKGASILRLEDLL